MLPFGTRLGIRRCHGLPATITDCTIKSTSGTEMVISQQSGKSVLYQNGARGRVGDGNHCGGSLLVSESTPRGYLAILSARALTLYHPCITK